MIMLTRKTIASLSTLSTLLLSANCARAQSPGPGDNYASSLIAQSAPAGQITSQAPELKPAMPSAGTSTSGNSTGLPQSPVATVPPSAIIATTTPSIDGYHVRRYLGVVRGVKVFQPTMRENFRASLKSLVGGEIGSYAEMCEKARQQAYDQVMERCTALGANAILGLRFDSSSFGLGSEMGTEVICYGTAVLVEADH